MYKSLVRPRLEFCIQARHLHLRKDIDPLEKIQRRATQLIYSLHDLPYEARLERLQLTMLETKRLHRDLMEVFKMMKGLVYVDFNSFIEIAHVLRAVHVPDRLSIAMFPSTQIARNF